MKTMGLLLGLILNLWISVAAVMAQSGYPQPTDLYINDYAHLLTATDAANIAQLLTDLKTKNGIEATVVTINSIKDYSSGDETIETFATHLFNIWGIGSKANHKGVLILVAVQDRQMRIELGTGYESQYNDDMQQIINEYMLPAFKQNNYSRGLYQGTRAVIATLTGDWPPDASPAAPPALSANKEGNVSAPVSRSSSDSSGFGFEACFFLIFIGAVLYSILARIFDWPLGNSSSSDSSSSGHSWSSHSRSSSSSSRSSGSSGSSFGGGKSSGGGASGGW